MSCTRCSRFCSCGESLAKSRIALEHFPYETRTIARPPEFCDVRDSITQGAAIVGGTALDRPWDADELCSHVICSEFERAFRDFGLPKSIRTDNEKNGRAQAHVAVNAVPRTHRFTRGFDVGQRREPARRPLGGNRIGHHAAHTATERYGHMLMIDLTLEEPIDRREEILTMVSSVKAEDVRGQHVREDLLPPAVLTLSMRRNGC